MLDERRYVYVLVRPDTGQPFYIGKGKGDRWMHHEMRNKTKNDHKGRVISLLLECGLGIDKFKVAEALSNDEACAMEKALIAMIGRHPHGPLTNRTDGGEGLVNPTAEVRERIGRGWRGKKTPPELVAKRTAKNTGQKRTPEQIARISAAKRSAEYSAEYRAKMVENGKRERSPEERAKIAASLRGKVSPKRGRPAPADAGWKCSRTKFLQRWGPCSDFLIGASGCVG